MTNINKLRGKIIEAGTNVTKLANTIGMDKSTLYRKLKNNGEEISIKEASLIIEALDLNLEEINAIFFSNFVAYSATKRMKSLKN